MTDCQSCNGTGAWPDGRGCGTCEQTGLAEFRPATTWNPARYGRTWEIRLPFTAVPLSLNDRSHWRAKAKRTREVRDAVLAEALRTPDLARAALYRCAVLLTYTPRDRRRRDADNLVATLKVCCDALVDAGVVADDTPDLMVKHMPVIAEPDGDPRLVLTIRAVLDDAP